MQVLPQLMVPIMQCLMLLLTDYTTMDHLLTIRNLVAPNILNLCDTPVTRTLQKSHLALSLDVCIVN